MVERVGFQFTEVGRVGTAPGRSGACTVVGAVGHFKKGGLEGLNLLGEFEGAKAMSGDSVFILAPVKAVLHQAQSEDFGFLFGFLETIGCGDNPETKALLAWAQTVTAGSRRKRGAETELCATPLDLDAELSEFEALVDGEQFTIDRFKVSHDRLGVRLIQLIKSAKGRMWVHWAGSAFESAIEQVLRLEIPERMAQLLCEADRVKNL